MRFRRGLLGVGALLALFLLVAPATVSANVNNFSIRSFEADYYLTRDKDTRRSEMRVVEKLVVQFPPFDQNHGIERAIPKSYNEHSVGLKVLSVKKEDGKAWPFSTYGSGGNTVLRIGDKDTFVKGIQTYLIEYSMRDVTMNVADSHDEIYWDANGTDWGQAFGSVTSRLHLSGDMATAYARENRCFIGAKGSQETCQIAVAEEAGEVVLTYKAPRMLYAGENLTFVASFAADTFAPYKPSTWQRILPGLIVGWLALGGLVLAATVGVLTVAWQRFGKSPEGKQVIIPQYLPPKDMSVLSASAILKKKGNDATAQIIDLAVRHYLRIYETETKGTWFRHKKSYELELVRKPTGLKAEEKQLLELVFGKGAQPGQRVTVEMLRSKLYKDTAKLQRQVETQAIQHGYLADTAQARKKYYGIGGVLLAAGVLLLNPGVAIAGIVTLIVASAFHPLTEQGATKRDYLRGLQVYMKLAEAERMQMLQSPEGAAKSRVVNASGPKQLVHIYERLLPYAIIFGMEREWVKHFASLYEQPPEWYSGNWSAFNAGVFATSLGGFTGASQTVFSAPDSSSSSGFSGSGSSGGGGGGGGGAGW